MDKKKERREGAVEKQMQKEEGEVASSTVVGRDVNIFEV